MPSTVFDGAAFFAPAAFALFAGTGGFAAAGVGAGDTTFEGVLLPPELDGRALGLDTDAGRLD